MSIFYRYVYGKFMMQFAIFLSIATAVYWLKDVFLLIDLIVEKNIPADFVLKTSFSTIPFIISMILPVISLICAVIVINTLSQNQEFIILRAAGFSSVQLAKPFMVIAFFLIIFHWLLTLWVLPLFAPSIARLKRMNANTFISPTMLSPGEITQLDSKTSVYVTDVLEQATFKNILVFHQSANTQEIIFAPKGVFRYESATDIPFITLYDAQLHKVNFSTMDISTLQVKEYVFPFASQKENFITPWVASVPSVVLYSFSDVHPYFAHIRSLHPNAYANLQSSFYRERAYRLFYPLENIALIFLALFILLSAPFRRGRSFHSLVFLVLATILYKQVSTFGYHHLQTPVGAFIYFSLPFMVVAFTPLLLMRFSRL